MKEITQERVWDKIAPEWKEFRGQMNEQEKNFLKTCNGKILDVGCGTGRNFLNKKGLEYTAVDFSQEMIKEARTNAQKKEINVKFARANTWNLPFEESLFEHALLYAVIHCIKGRRKQKKTFEEIFRVLKKNGTAMISCWSGKGPRLNAHKEKKETTIPWTIKGKKYERYTYIFSEEELKKLIEGAGLKIEKYWEDKNYNFIVKK